MKGKIIVLTIIIIFLGSGYLISYHRKKIKEENTRTVITEAGDEFIISTDTTLFHKTTLINKKCDFYCGINDYDPDDDLILLCNTENVTIYKISEMKICKVKKYDRIILLESYDKNDTDMYEYLNDVIADDKDANFYLKESIAKWQSNSKQMK
jgi:hypothetical protein